MPRQAQAGDTIGPDFTNGLFGVILKASTNVLAIIRANRLDQMAAPNTDLSMASHRLVNVQDGISGQDAVTMHQFTGALILKGSWNATTNTPTLADGTGTAGWQYIVATAGTQNLGSGSITFAIGDTVTYNGTTWFKVAGGGTSYTAGTGISISGAAIGLSTPVAVGNGGTGVATSTGSGANVLGTAPSITAPTGIVAADVGLGSVTNDAQLKIASNLSDLASVATARTNLSVAPYGRTAISNTSYTILATDREIAQTGSLSTTRTFTLPLANTVPPSWRVLIIDESGTVTTANQIVLVKQGSDTLHGTTAISNAYGAIEAVSDGTSKWTTVNPASSSSPSTSAGFTYYPGSLDRFRFFTPVAGTPVDIVIAGDSTVANTLGSYDEMATRLGRVWGREVLPSLGPGFRGMWRSDSVTLDGDVTLTTDQQEWGTGRTIAGTVMSSGTRFVGPVTNSFSAADVGQTITGTGIPGGTTIVSVVSTVAPHTSDSVVLSQTATLGATTATVGSDVAWTKTLATDAFDVGPFGECFYVTTGSAATMIHWTKPSTMTSPIVAFDLLYADVGTGGGPIQYVLDDTQSGWATISTTRVGGNVLRRVRVQAAIANRITFRTNGGPIGFVGIIPYYLNPVTNVGIVVHNLGRNGQYLQEFVKSTSGDRMAIISGHPGSLNPILATEQFYNDISLNNVANWGTNTNAWIARVQPVCDTILINIWEASGVATLAKTYRDMTKTVALAAASAGTPVGVIDNYDLLVAYGYTGFTAVSAAGLIRPSDGVHPTQALINIVASAIHRYVDHNS